MWTTRNAVVPPSRKFRLEILVIGHIWSGVPIGDENVGILPYPVKKLTYWLKAEIATSLAVVFAPPRSLQLELRLEFDAVSWGGSLLLCHSLQLNCRTVSSVRWPPLLAILWPHWHNWQSWKSAAVRATLWWLSCVEEEHSTSPIYV